MTDAELEALQGWVEGEFELDAEESAKKWVLRLLAEVKRLNEFIERTVETTGIMVRALQAENARLREALDRALERGEQ